MKRKWCAKVQKYEQNINSLFSHIYGRWKMEPKVVVITGASSGIGRALAQEYAKRGWCIALLARNLDKLLQLKNELSEKASKILCLSTDVSKEEDCKEAIKEIIATYGRIDVLINNAGVSMRALFKDVDLDVIRRLMDVNFWGTVYCTKYALPSLLANKGSVVGIVSIAAYIGLPGRTGYSASKFAIRGFLETLRTENLRTGLHVLVAAPGFTATNIRSTALLADGSQQGQSPRDEGKMMTAAQVAKKVVKAIDKRKKTLILTFWEGKFTVFLQKFFPTLVERLTFAHMAKEPDSPFK
ncbi:MAG: 3-oxoacyl-ACP reductase [Bacteroidetes bacterium 38_7]|jgi:short-subunit dehydrogenase|nr:MAG: 3-oxoacyl-ACP reductase [Bacteroidetes bacterium 38_7]